jgi:glycosyltransferase involved in cell wall biosynthesis
MLILCGDGELRPDIERRIGDLHLENAVIMLGHVNNIEEYFCAADILVFPSLFEGFPLTVIEAQASGISCVVSTAITQTALFAVNTKRVTSFNISDWIEVIQSTFAIHYKRENGYDCVEEAGFNISEQSVKLANLYRSVIERETL